MSNFLIDEDTDLLAAEFVLGTLDAQERANAQLLLRTDHGFIAMVRIWERRFGELHLMVEPVEPDAKILQRIKAKIAEIAGERAPDGQPPTEVTPSLEPPAAGIGSSAEAETTMPADAPTASEAPKPDDVPPTGTMPQPAQVSATAEAVTPAETPPGSEATIPPASPPPASPPPASPPPASPPPANPPPATLPPAANLSAVGPPAALATAPAAGVPAAAEVPPAAIATPPPELPPSLKLPDRPPDKLQAQRSARRQEGVIRSRARWRMLGVCMTLLVMGVVALLGAWKFAPDRVPPGLRPAELMMRVGIEALPAPAPAAKREPPVSQFDE